ncbi:MAG: flagellar hook-basal body complex protein FliE [Desulfobacteraceae bacterium]|nr:flagellar hook-basal body complex protein FliE [Desulfobacteraceae bacterium]
MANLRIGSPTGPAVGPTAPGSTAKTSDPTGFGDILEKSISAVNSQAQEADELAAGLMSGRHANIHETMIAMEKADISFRLLTKVQNKVIAAYEEIQRLQL